MIMSTQKKKRFKKLVQPEELIVWYILPSIRLEITIALIEKYKLPQKDIALKFGLTEPAISQSKKGDRGNLDLAPEIIKQVAESARRIAEEDNFAPREVQRVLKFIRKGGYLCKYHKEFGMVHEGCEICKVSID